MDNVGFNEGIFKANQERIKKKYGQPCEGCIADCPEWDPSILFPGQKCRKCGWIDQREREPGIHR